MTEQTIKDYYGRTVGYIRTDSAGNKTAYDFYKRKLGTYEKNKDITKDFYGRIISKGDVLSSLIFAKEMK